MSDSSIKFRVNGAEQTAVPGTTVAAAVALAGVAGFRTSVSGQARGPLCGMGICFECRVMIDGEPHRRSCSVMVREGMEVRTDG